jgi:hypothetical protein
MSFRPPKKKSWQIAGSLSHFKNVFPDDEACLHLLAQHKWKAGFVCIKCGGTNYCKGKSALSRRCTKCKTEESATAHTIFHRCKIPLVKAFEIAFIVCNIPDTSSYEMSRQLGMRHMTCYNFQKKVQACIQGERPDPVFESLQKEVNKRVNRD